MRITRSEQREFDKRMQDLIKNRALLDRKEELLRKEYRIPKEPTPDAPVGLKIPDSATSLGEPLGLYVKVQVRKLNGELSNRFEYIKLEE